MPCTPGLLSQTVGSDPAVVVELRMECFPPDAESHPALHHASCDRPLLFIRLSNGCLAVYRSSPGAENIGVKFVKLPIDMPLLWQAGNQALLHRFDDLSNADAHARARKYRCAHPRCSGYFKVILLCYAGCSCLHGCSELHLPSCVARPMLLPRPWSECF